MDLSKLPKLSHSPPPPPQQAPESATAGHGTVPYEPVDRITPGRGAEIWISAIVGLVLILMGINFGKWAVTTLGGGEYHTGVQWMSGPLAGQEVGYWELVGMVAFTDAGLFVLGLALVFEALLLALLATNTRLRFPVTVFTFALTLIATLFNAYVCIRLFGAGIMPLVSLLAVAFGGYMAMYLYRLMHAMRRAPE